MIQRREAAALASAVLCALIAIVRIADNGDDTPVPTSEASGGSARPIGVSDDSLETAADNTVDNDPFRLANRPSSVRYDARTDGGLGAPTPSVPPVRPQLAVRAIMGGPPWQAVVDGIPGQPSGIVVASGLVFDKLKVRSVGRDTVVIQGPDTVWKLTLTQSHP